MSPIAIRRLRILPVSRGEGLSGQESAVVQAELASLGYRLSNPALLEQIDASWLIGHAERCRLLAAERGGDRDYVPLFLGFPESTPEDGEYLMKRIVGFIGTALALWEQDDSAVTLDNGTVVPRWLFSLREFGADPVTQFQTKSLFERAREQLAGRKADASVEWIDLALSFPEETDEALRDWMIASLRAKSSLKDEAREDVRALLRRFGAEGIDLDDLPFKEHRALVLATLWEASAYDEVVKLATSATDALRLFAVLTGTDASLSEEVKYPRMTRAQRRCVLRILDEAPSLGEDLRRHRNLWRAVSRGLHAAEHARRFPKAASALSALRDGKVSTFASVTEGHLQARRLDELLVHLSLRPGVFTRRLHELLRRFSGEEETVLSAYAAVAHRVPLKTLLVLDAHLGSINDRLRRAVIIKTGAIQVLDNPAYRALDEATVLAARAVLEEAMLAQLASRPSWSESSVWIDPALRQVTVPLQQRAASDGLITLGRGSRIPLSSDKVLRLFVWWKQSQRRTDLDLSCITFGADWSYQGHVSYTNLKAEGIVHSGDLQSAPHGAAEFIDIGLSTLRAAKADARYLAPQVYRYSGEAFAQMEAMAGWMVRDRVDSSIKSFDVKTVQNAFQLTGQRAYSVPFVVDLVSQEIVLVDLYMGSKTFHNAVEGAYFNVARACEQVVDFALTRPTMERLACLHRKARGATWASREQAALTFGVSEGTYAASDVERVLSELL